MDLKKRISEIEHNLEVKTKELDFERKKSYELLFSSTFRSDSIVEENGNRKYYNPSFQQKVSEKETASEIEKQKDVEADFFVEEKTKEIDKRVDKKQFNLWALSLIGMSFFVILLFVLRLFKSKWARSLFM